MDRREWLAWLGALGLFSVVPDALRAVSAGRSASPPQGSDEALERLLRLANVPSLSLAEVDGDRVTTLAVGNGRAGDATPVTADSVYAAASLTKTVFTYAFLDLVLDGAISLDRPLHEYLPLPNPGDARARAITARHLLSHTGGWRNWRNNERQQLTTAFEPGSRWSYSGEGFFFLQRLAEHVTGDGVGIIVRERVLDPLGMTRSSMVRREDLEGDIVAGHDTEGQPLRPFGTSILLELRRAMAAANRPLEAARVEDVEAAIRNAEPRFPALPNFAPVNAAASLLTSAGDFGRFLRHFVTARRQGGRPAAVVDMMMTPRIRRNEAIAWGHGVGIESVDGVARAWQWGDNPGFKNIYFADPAGEQAIAVFTNGDRGARVYERVIRERTGMDHPAFLLL